MKSRVLALLTACGLALVLAALSPSAIGAPGDAPQAVTGVSRWLNVEAEQGRQSPTWGEDGRVDFATLQGKVVVLEFWATWCPPCRRTVPHLNQLHAEHAQAGLVVLGLTTVDRRQSEDHVRRFVGAEIDYPVGLLADDETLRRYQIQGIPYAVVVGRDGKQAWSGNPLSPEFERAVRLALRADAG